jgi:acyl-coenzyme A synthetase/AMP-(fatty) acid ligase
VGYLDQEGRFWYCGRKSHRVITAAGTLFTDPCETVINMHKRVYRSALVGLGPPGQQRSVIIVETWPEHRPRSAAERASLIAELQQHAQSHKLTCPIRDVLLHDSLPVDIRHNFKIFREKLAVWAEKRLRP